MGTLIRSQNDVWVRAEDASAIGALRRTAVALAGRRGFGEEDVGRVAVAVSEAASNLVKHAVEGIMLIRPHPELDTAVEVLAVDRGPGMGDVARALRDGYSTTGTLGIGLGGITRMASGYEVHSIPGRGTVLGMYFVAHDSPHPASLASGVTRPIGVESVCGDAFVIAETGDTMTAMLCDGLGHGGAAAQASQQAARIFAEHAETDPTPVALLERIHRGLNHTRGGAVAVARVDRAAGKASFAGLGNVSAWIVHQDGRQGMVSVPGIAGHQARTLRQYEYTVPPHGVVVLHSDGLSERWDITTYPGLVTRLPSVIAATLLRDAGTRRDDACVVALRPGV
ncbi:anti-sigma regulatory factor (Ser/Thr protein kinase) [Streptosporangium becharense]|uniref:Anti-sigma regulatory factor (Ser/Thr protein kinase) n=1 Tax=Streptosporangium becharense TaxID=1816182 RepID=A0A7W9IDY4_9ACTN|nr:SpoIIE family protein phosphatase [Streptosporangium becharense]MBB2912184.1 anti-sigma regulatory factor (Ser/Thr protein kinase) [Streptosporangium becharense]MBB5818731.1 anti-sigma regulatory factor (Ser/Thr protein kinase) [Streptosporangium becharense]